MLLLVHRVIPVIKPLWVILERKKRTGDDTDHIEWKKSQ
jgi:hypothetical protein